MSNMVLKIAKVGYDIRDADPKDLVLSSQFNTFKIYKTGTLTVSLPAKTFSEGETAVYAERVEHDFGYIPFFIPGVNVVASNALDSDTVILNELAQALPPAGAYSPSLYLSESSNMYVTSSDLVLSVTRRYERPLGIEPVTIDYVSKMVSVYYTIFYNRLDAEFNLL